MGVYNSLSAAGLINEHADDLGVLALSEKKIIIQSYCLSDKCCAYTSYIDGRLVRRVHARVTKDAGRGPCPDCGHQLVVRRKVKS